MESAILMHSFCLFISFPSTAFVLFSLDDNFSSVLKDSALHVGSTVVVDQHPWSKLGGGICILLGLIGIIADCLASDSTCSVSECG